MAKARKQTKRPKSPAQLAVSEAGRISGQIIAHMKNITRAYLQVGGLLSQVRDEKVYDVLHKKTLEDYAKEVTHIKRRSLYQYLAAYAWAKKNHPEWLKPGYKGPLPDLNDVIALCYLDGELAKDNVEPQRRKRLKELRAKGEAGTLRKSEVDAVRKRSHSSKESLRGVLALLQSARRQGLRLKSMSPEALAHIDAAIELLSKQEGLRLAGLSFDGLEGLAGRMPIFV